MRAGYAFNLIGFVANDERMLSNSLNTLEFCLKFKQALSSNATRFGDTTSHSASRASSAYLPPREENVLEYLQLFFKNKKETPAISRRTS